MQILTCSLIVKFIAAYVQIVSINRIVNWKSCSGATDKSAEIELIYLSALQMKNKWHPGYGEKTNMRV